MYPLFNPLAKVPFTDAELQLFEIARFFGGDQQIEMNILTGDFDQNEVEFYSGILVFRGSFEFQQTFLQRVFRKKTALQEVLHKIDAHIYMMSGASGLTKPIAEFCRDNHRSFLFRVSHQRDCDGTFVHGDPEGSAYRWALHHADFILCQTEDQKRIFQRTEGLNAIKIPNAIRFEPLPETPRTDVLWIGEAVEWKQPELFYRLALTIPNQNFTLITRPNNPDYFERLVSKTRDVPNLGLENSVPYFEWPSYLNRARILVNTSRYEGFPFSFSQAFAMGIPVASLNVSPDGVLDEKQVGFWANGSEVRLAQGVSDILAYPRQWKRLSDNAMNYARSELNPQRTLEEYRKIFQACVTRKKRRAIKSF